MLFYNAHSIRISFEMQKVLYCNFVTYFKFEKWLLVWDAKHWASARANIL